MAYNIKRYTYGTVVKYNTSRGCTSTWTYGHIVGFSRNSTGETTLLIRGDDKQHELHPANVELDFDGLIR